jgi:LPXTG-site transpeptidase (sortase) family protein
MPSSPSRSLVRWALLVVVLSGAALSIALIFHFGPVRIGSPPPTARPAVQPKKVGVPVRLKLPKINVDAPIEQVGLTSDGALDVPKGPANTGWYNAGPRPGENGSAVIDGHFDLENNPRGVFFDLNKLQAGDKLSVEDETGTTITFVVRESRKYDPNADASTVFRSSDGKAHLNLITCSGVWDTAQQSYSNRLVVFTDRENAAQFNP